MNVTLTENEWNQLLNAAALAPYGQVAQLLNKVTDQLIKQQTPVAAPQEKAGD